LGIVVKFVAIQNLATMNPTFHNLVIKDVRKETEDAVSIAFEVPENLANQYAFKPGQYLTLRAMIDGEDVRRSYSICAGLNDHELRVAVKEVPQGKFSTYANRQLQVGDTLAVMTPTGNFTTAIDASTAKSFVFFAAGSGITPILSLSKTILENAPKSDVTLIYGNKNSDSVIFKEDIEALKNKYMNTFRLVHVFSRENIGNPLQKGRIDKEKAHKLAKAFLINQHVDEVFICGPEQMIFDVTDALAEEGIEKERIRFELFTSPSQVKAKATDLPKEKSVEVQANVTIIIDDEHTLVDLHSDGESILDAGHRAGADLPFACKGGVCCTCKAKIIEGTARMDVNYALEKDEVEAGFILTCQAHPTSEKLVVSFDE
jgi:ring-1,2-phenylacetyl-CoA epoxidase subunit PaaE